jgi:hypothetical protein
MTAAGIALIAGGLATLIGFRKALWAGNDGRRARATRAIASSPRVIEAEGPRPIETSRRRAELGAAPQRARPAAVPAQAGAPEISGAHAAADILAEVAAQDEAAEAPTTMMAPIPAEVPVSGVASAASAGRRIRRGRRRGRAGNARVARSDAERDAPVRDKADLNTADRDAADRESGERFGLASIGLAGDDDFDDDFDGEPAGRAADVLDGDAGADPERFEPSLIAGAEAESGYEPETVFEPEAAIDVERDIDLEPGFAVEPGLGPDEPRLGVDSNPDAERETAVDAKRGPMTNVPDDEPSQRRLARAVLARADAGTREGARFDLASGRLIRPHEETTAARSEATGGPAAGDRRKTTSRRDELRTGRGYGDRVDGWIRPQYADQPNSPAGDYWTPAPDSAYADLDSAGYGWPVPIERLPAVPWYPPASGFDVDPIEEAEPTAVVPQWPPAQPSNRIELPRAWSATGPMNRRPLDSVTARRWAEADDDGRDGWRRNRGPEEGGDGDDPRRNRGPQSDDDGDDWRRNHGPEGDGWRRNESPADGDRRDRTDRPEADSPEPGDQPGENGDDGDARALWPGEEQAIWVGDERAVRIGEEHDQRPRRRAMMIRRGSRPDADQPSRGRQARAEARRRLGGPATGASATGGSAMGGSAAGGPGDHPAQSGDPTQMLPALSAQDRDTQPRRRPRPRPNPQSESRSTVYVSRHAAEPPN